MKNKKAFKLNCACGRRNKVAILLTDNLRHKCRKLMLDKIFAILAAVAVLIFGTSAYANSSGAPSEDYSGYSALNNITVSGAATPTATPQPSRTISTEGTGHVVDNITDSDNLQFISVTAKAMYKKVNVELNQPSPQEYCIGNEKINALTFLLYHTYCIKTSKILKIRKIFKKI